MIGSGLKKLANQHGMTVSNGVAYGSLMGYATTLSEGSGYKLIDISTTFPELAQKDAFYAAVNAVDLSRTYRVQGMEIGNRRITVNFLDNPGTMKKLEAFIAWFYPLLAQHGATGANICAECGGDAAAGGWYMINGSVHRFHDSCAEHLKTTLETEQQTEREQDTGSYVQGFFGALLGSLLGAVVWAILYYVGFFASIAGLLMGWLADKGYNLLHGKQGKGKVAILVIVVILGVIIGILGGEAIYIAEMIGSGEAPGFVYGDIPFIILEVLMVDSQALATVAGNIAMGLLFAGLGVFALLKKSANEVADVKFKKLY